MPIVNSYCIPNTPYSYCYYNGSLVSSTEGRIAENTLKTYTVTLGDAFAYDVYGTNSGYPVLAWENQRPEMKLNKNQAYIKIGETLNLNILEDEEITGLIEGNYDSSNFTWKSINEDIARVDKNGNVTGLKDRIYDNLCKA